MSELYIVLSCTLCDKTFQHRDNVGNHVITREPEASYKPWCYIMDWFGDKKIMKCQTSV